MASRRRLAEHGKTVPVDDAAGEQTCRLRAITFLVDIGIDEVPVIVFLLVALCLWLVVRGIGNIAVESGYTRFLSAIARLLRWAWHWRARRYIFFLAMGGEYGRNRFGWRKWQLCNRLARRGLTSSSRRRSSPTHLKALIRFKTLVEDLFNIRKNT